MKDYYDALFHKHYQSGVFLDTNILLLYFVGIVDENLVSRFKRTANRYCVEDYYLLCNLLPYFSKIVTTPHILTEVSNLAGQLSGRVKEEFFLRFANGISLFDEHYTCSADIAGTSAFIKFGLTDAGIVYLKTHLVLTEDASLAWYLQSQGIDVINFNHIRSLNW
jgi:hypothetical protein